MATQFPLAPSEMRGLAPVERAMILLVEYLFDPLGPSDATDSSNSTGHREN